MKKIILLFFTISIMSFGTQKYDFRFKDVDILQIKMSRRYNGIRSLAGVILNKSNENIKYVKFNVKIKNKNITKDQKYYTIGEISSCNISPNKKVKFKTYLRVLDLDERDFEVELTDLVMSKQ